MCDHQTEKLLSTTLGSFLGQGLNCVFQISSVNRNLLSKNQVSVTKQYYFSISNDFVLKTAMHKLQVVLAFDALY